MPPDFDPKPAATALLHARATGASVHSSVLDVPDAAAAYAVQDATMAALGPTGGWKVGAKSPQDAPHCAPLPASGVLPSGAAPGLPPGALRGIELEVAVRLRHDLLPGGRPLTVAELQAAVGEVIATIELVDSRLSDRGKSSPWPALADLQAHAALIVGASSGVAPADLDLKALRARLWFDEVLMVDLTGGHPSPDLWRLLGWLALHCEARGQPLRAGQVVTTGSLTGLPIAPPGTLVRGLVEGIGEVHLQV